MNALAAVQPSLQSALEAAEHPLDLPLFEIAGTHVTLATLISIAVVLLLTLLVGRVATGVFGRVLRARGKAGEGEVRALVRVLRYAIWLLGLAIGLSTAGINLNALFAAGAVFAVAVGFAMQNVVQNFVAGVILLLERAIKPGDVLEVEGKMVKVVQMGIRTTIARTLDDEDLVIPNGTLVQSSVKNFTLRDAEYRVRVQVGVSYGSDMKRVGEILLATASAIRWRLAKHQPRVLLTAFGSSSVDWEVSVWTDDPWRVRTLRSDLHLAIWDALQKGGVTIAFPQLDVHLDREVEKRLSGEATGRGEASAQGRAAADAPAADLG